MGQITIKDLSKLLGVSISTISKALNDSHEISSKTKERINEAAKLYGYQPNPIAKRLKHGKTYTIAVVIPSIQDSFFMRVLHGIEEAASHTAYNIITCSTRNTFSKEVEIVKNLSNGIVDGFIIAPAKETLINEDFIHFIDAVKSNKPIVWVDRGIDKIRSSVVESNNTNAVYHATRQLIGKGRKRIAVVSYNSKLSTGRDRIEGYIQAIIEQRWKLDSSLIVDRDNSCTLDELSGFLVKKKIDGIICTDENASYDVLKAAKKLDKNIPKDISIIGYADEKVAQNLDPELATINQHRKTIGEISLRTLVNQLTSENSNFEKIRVDSTLQIRRSF